MASIGAIIRREFKYIISNKRLLAILLIIPIFYTSLFGLLYCEHLVKGIKTVVVDQDKTAMSRMVIEAFQKSDKYELVASLPSEAEIAEYIESERAEAAIVIPKDFSSNVYQEEESPLLIIVNGSNMIISNSVTTSALQIVQTLSTGIAATKVETGGGVDFDQAVRRVNPLSFRIKTWYNPTYNYTNFLLLGLLATVVQQVTLLYVAVAMVREIEKGTLPELQQLKGGALVKVLGKTIPYLLFAFGSYAVTMLEVRYIFDVPFRGSLAAWFLLGLLFLFCIISLGIFLSLVCRSELESTQISMLIAVPSFLFSGFTWPLQAMPLLCRGLAAVLPLTYFAPALRKVALMGAGVSGIRHELTGLAVMSLILVPLSVLVYKWKYEKREIKQVESSKEAGKMKKTFSLTMIVCLLMMAAPVMGAETAAATEPYTLTLQEAVDLTLRKSPDLSMADVYVDLANRAKVDSREMYDDIKAGINGTVYAANQKLQALDMQKQAILQATGGDPQKLKMAAPDLAALEVARQGIIYSMGAVDLMSETNKNIKEISERAAEGYDDARQARQDAERKLAFGVEKLYLSMLTLDNFITVQEDNLELQRELVRIERLKHENGLSTAVEVDKATQKGMEEQQRLHDLQKIRLQLTYQMNRNIGRPWDAPLRLALVGFQPVKTEELEAGYQKALETSLAIKQQQRTLETKRDDLKSRDLASDKEEKIKIEIRKTELELQDTQFQLRKNLEDLHANLANAKQNLITCKQKYGTARADYEQAMIAYENQMGLKAQVDGSKLIMDKNYNDYAKASYDYYLAARELQLGQDGLFLDN